MKEYVFKSDPTPVEPVDIVAQIWGAPSQEEATQEALQLLEMFRQAGLTPDEIVAYLRNAPWRQGREG